MSYLLKIQTSPGAVVEFLLNKSKRYRKFYQCCKNYPKCTTIFWSNSQNFSNYVSALKTLPERKAELRKDSSPLKKEFYTKDISKAVLLLKKGGSRKKTVLKKHSLYSCQKSRVKLKNNFSVCSTKSYDPNFLVFNLEVEKYYKDLGQAQSVEKKKLTKTGSKRLIDDVEISELDVETNKDLKLKTNFTINKDDIFKILNVNQVKKAEECKPVKKSIHEDERVVHEDLLQTVPQEKTSESDKIEEHQKLYLNEFCLHLTPNHSMIQALHSAVDICVTNDMLSNAIALVQSHRKKSVWKGLIEMENINVVNIYNTLLFGLAAKGQWDTLQEIRRWMDLDNLKLNCDSFTAFLYCLAKLKEAREDMDVKMITKIINELFMNNYSLDDIFSKTRLTKDQSDKILGIVHDVLPFFEIRPSTIKLNSNCRLLKDLYASNTKLQPPIHDLDSKTLVRCVNEQISVEKKFLIEVKAVSRGNFGEVTCTDMQRIDNLKAEWKKSLTKALENVLKIGKMNYLHSLESSYLYIYLSSLPVETLVENMMQIIENMLQYSGTYSPSTAYFHYLISSRVAQTYFVRKKEICGVLDKTEELFKQYTSWYLDPNGPARNYRQKWQMLIQDSEKSSQLDCNIIFWPEEVLKLVGKCLLDMIIKEVKFSVNNNDGKNMKYSVFFTMLRNHDKVWREEIKCHPFVSSLFKKIGFDKLSFRADQVPMLCPPKPWKSFNHGGYLLLPTEFVRKTGFIQGKVIKFKDVPPEHLYATLDALNTLQAVPWMINEDILDVALDVFKNGGSKELNVPHFPQQVQQKNEAFKSICFKEQVKRKRRLQFLRQQHSNEYGLWCEALYRFSLAHHFRKRIFWFPQNCDFRGRVYPVPPLLNHLGADLFRSLLVFAKGKPLGPNGLDWIKIHLINLTGTHKTKTIEERLDYANEILPEILDSAEKPLTGNKWWTKSGEPWQTLAACKEIKKILSSPDPENYVCRYPIHQDGSCNGLQHYAALGKDEIGAESVNLAALNTPQDVYTRVASLIEEERIKDAGNGMEVAKVLNGFIGRKVIKQTVMTTVYGVTAYGAKLQIMKRLEELPNFPPEYIQPAAAYLTDKTFLCLKKMFTSARGIQDWFLKCARIICSANDYVQWITPLGLPVLQSYGKVQRLCNTKKKIIVPNAVKQKNAFPPNFIHSLDSSHMMLTALFCEQVGLTFAAVHDCFWTHPSSLEIMNRICREQFISLHSEPILEILSENLKNQYYSFKNKTLFEEFTAVPEKGNFNLQNVCNSVYFFS